MYLSSSDACCTLPEDLLALLALAGIIWLLHRLSQRSPDVLFRDPGKMERTLLVVLFAGFVVGGTVYLGGLFLPVGLGVLRDRLEEVEEATLALNPGATPSCSLDPRRPAPRAAGPGDPSGGGQATSGQRR